MWHRDTLHVRSEGRSQARVWGKWGVGKVGVAKEYSPCLQWGMCMGLVSDTWVWFLRKGVAMLVAMACSSE